MTCPVCSMVNPEGSRTCMRCGTALPETSSGFGQPAAPAGPPSGQQPPAGQPYGGPGSGQQPAQPNPYAPAGPPPGQQPSGQPPAGPPPSGPPSGQQEATQQFGSGFNPFDSGQQPQQPGYGQQPPPPASPFGGPPSGQQPAAPPAYGGYQSGQEATQQFGGYQSGQQPAAPGGYGQQPPAQQPGGFGGGYDSGQQPQYGQQTYGGQQYGQPPAQQPGAFGAGYDSGQQPTQAFGGQQQYSYQSQPQPAQPTYGQQPYQDPYAQQQFGYEQQPTWQATPPQKSGRKGLWIGLGVFVVVVAVVVGVLFATGVLQKKVLDANALDSDIANQYKDRFTQAVKIDCPKDQAAKSGTTFTCSIEGSTQKIEVSVKDSSGNYTWRVTG